MLATHPPHKMGPAATIFLLFQTTKLLGKSYQAVTLLHYLPSFTSYTNKATMTGEDIHSPCTYEYLIAGA